MALDETGRLAHGIVDGAVTEQIDPREFGRLEQEVAHLTKQMDVMQATLVDISTTLTEARGGWRIVMLIGGAGATVGGLVAFAVQHLRITP